MLLAAVFLDVFHGKAPGNQDEPIFYSKGSYYFSLLFCIFWAISIPYTRFLMGVHSLDQIVYGSTLGLWSGLTMHFLVRDNVISHIESIIL